MSAIIESQDDCLVAIPMTRSWGDVTPDSLQPSHTTTTTTATTSPMNIFTDPSPLISSFSSSSSSVSSSSSHASLNTVFQKEPTETITLHDYRKTLSQSQFDQRIPVSVPPNTPQTQRRLKRKNGTVNLNPARPWINQSSHSVSVTGSSEPSSPPPLSPSISMSIMSQRSDPDLLNRLGGLSVMATSSCPEVNKICSGHRINSVKRTDQNYSHYPDRQEEKTSDSKNSRRRSQSVSDAYPMSIPSEEVTVSHEGTPFEILNPRRSLDASRIVSFIEDADLPAGGGRSVSLRKGTVRHHPSNMRVAERKPSSASTSSTASSTWWPLADHRPPTRYGYRLNENPKIPSPSPGMDLTNPYAALPRCEDLPRIPHHSFRPGPLSYQTTGPSAATTSSSCYEHGYGQGRSGIQAFGIQPLQQQEDLAVAGHTVNYYTNEFLQTIPTATAATTTGNATHLQLVGDSPDPPIPSISERLKQQQQEIGIGSSEHGYTSGQMTQTTTTPYCDEHRLLAMPSSNTLGMDQNRETATSVHTWLPKPGTEEMKERRKMEARESRREKMEKLRAGWVSFCSLFRGNGCM